MHTSNTIELTQGQKAKLHLFVNSKFESLFTDEYWHFSINGTRLNLKSMKQQCVFEIHSNKGSFWGLIDLNEKHEGLKRSLKFQDIDNLS